MKSLVAVLAAVLVVLPSLAISQSVHIPDAQFLAGCSTFLGQPAAIPEGYLLRLSSAFSPYDRNLDYVYGNAGLTIDGLLEVTLSHEGAIGSPVGLLRPVPQVGLRLQIVPQRGNFPAVSLFLRTMTGNQSELIGQRNLESNLPAVYCRGLNSISYDARSTTAGVALATTFDEVFSFGATLGIGQAIWKQGWSRYSRDIGLPSQPDGWTLPLAEDSQLRLNLSATAAIRPIYEVSIMGEVATMPFIDIDPTSLLAVARQGTVVAMGLRYFLPIPLTMDVYDRWYSESVGGTGHHQLRVGLSSGILFE